MNEQKQSCLTCKNFFNLKLFMKSDNRPEELHRCLVTSVEYLVGHSDNDYKCECSHFEPTTPKEQ